MAQSDIIVREISDPKQIKEIHVNPIVKTFQYGQHTVTLETGVMARQATGAVMASMDDTSVFVSVVGKKEAVAGRDFFPLTVNYQERTYAAGRIPGGFFKREGRPSEAETLIARLIDRPIRPLFPEGFLNEVQVIATVVSANPQVPTDIIAILGASAALAISGIPFNGPIGAARVGYINGQYVLNPTNNETKHSDLDLVVAGTEAAVLMVESEAKILSEETMLGAVVYGHEQMQTAIQAINEFAAEVGTKAWDWQAPAVNTALKNKIAELATAPLGEAYRITEKAVRYETIAELKQKVVEQIVAEDETQDAKLVDNASVKYGSYFGQKEVEEGKNVCVISDADAKRLFGTDDVVGMTLDITCYDLTKTFRICGVTTQKENGTFVSYTYDGMPVTINVPYTAMDDFTGSSGEFYQIIVQADKSLDSQAVADKIINLLERRHQCAGDEYFQVQSFQDVMKSMNQMLGMVTAFISFVAGISLLVGGIGVMNIMLVSVTERRKSEIA